MAEYLWVFCHVGFFWPLEWRNGRHDAQEQQMQHEDAMEAHGDQETHELEHALVLTLAKPPIVGP